MHKPKQRQAASETEEPSELSDSEETYDVERIRMRCVCAHARELRARVLLRRRHAFSRDPTHWFCAPLMPCARPPRCRRAP